MHRCLTRICPEANLYRAQSAQTLGDQRNSFSGEKGADEGCVLLTDGRRLETGHNITRAKSFGNQFPPVTAFLHDGVDQEFHGMDPAARRPVVARAASGKQDVVHSANTRDRIMKAHGDTRTQESL